MSVETATQQSDGDPIATLERPKKSSGYSRMRARFHKLIAEHEALQQDYYGLLDEQRALQADVDRLLEQHGRLIQSVKAPLPAANWFELANRVLAQLAQSPDPRAVQIFTAALAQLQTRIGPIVMRTPIT